MNYSNVFAIQSFCMSSQYKIFPRIKYGKIVLSPAKWYISIEDLYLKEKSFKQFKQAFGEYRERYCIPEAVYAGNADNRLYLNCIDDCDLQILYNMLMAGISMQKGLKRKWGVDIMKIEIFTLPYFFQ